MFQRCVQRVFWFVVRWVLSLRYRVRVEGAEALAELRGPTIVMPNHPAYIDPPLVLSHLRLHAPLRPLVYTGTYRLAALYPVMRAMGAVEVPELRAHSRSAQQAALAMIERITSALRRGESILVYPAGRLQQQGQESIGATRAPAELLRACPEANVVLVRTRGLWGSRFSWARTGHQPKLLRVALRGVADVLANLILLMPRRPVTMTVEVVSRGQLPPPERELLNPFLEEWYNREGAESPSHVPSHFLGGRRGFAFPDSRVGEEIDYGQIRPATRAAVQEMIEEHLGRPLSAEETDSTTALEQIGLDSLERMDLALEIEQRFGFRSDRVANTMGELGALAEGLLTGDEGHASAVPARWWRRPAEGEAPAPLAETLAEAFLRRAQASAADVAVADRLSGVLTYRRLLVGARLLSRRFSRLEGDAVGVMLPASVAADVVFFALHLAGKLPVLLNWTTGPAHLAHAVRTMQVRHVVTSQRFIDRLGIQIEDAQYVLLEPLRAGVGRMEAIRTLLTTVLFPQRLLRRLPPAKPDQAAVVLFTSGSEAAPKAVPLSHANLMADIRGGFPVLRFRRDDVMLGFLPPFHSFGVAVNLIAPILTGIRVVHHADPTDARGLVATLAQYRATLLFTTPTFLSYMLSQATSDDFRSLRMIVTGAEKCPQQVRETCARLAPQAEILEGYGITECSPVVSVCPPGQARPGSVGPPLPGVQTRVVDPETHTPRELGQTGLLLVAGPTVFAGYLNYDGPDPFVEVEGQRWYNTGDLVSMDADDFIFFRGRLKRFLKIGGEMVSLPALEEPLAVRYPPTEEGPQVAVEGAETPKGHRIVLFTTRDDLSLRTANAVLTEAGLRGVMRLDQVQKIPQIPVLGTGKTDYKVLRRKISEQMSGEQHGSA